VLFMPPVIAVCFLVSAVVALFNHYVDLHCGGFKAWFPPPANQDPQEAAPMLERRASPVLDKKAAPVLDYGDSYGEIGLFHAMERGRRLDEIAEEPTHWPGAHTTDPEVDFNGGYPDPIEGGKTRTSRPASGPRARPRGSD